MTRRAGTDGRQRRGRAGRGASRLTGPWRPRRGWRHGC